MQFCGYDRENGLFLSRRDGSHDGCGWKQRCM